MNINEYLAEKIDERGEEYGIQRIIVDKNGITAIIETDTDYRDVKQEIVKNYMDMYINYMLNVDRGRTVQYKEKKYKIYNRIRNIVDARYIEIKICAQESKEAEIEEYVREKIRLDLEKHNEEWIDINIESLTDSYGDVIVKIDWQQLFDEYRIEGSTGITNVLVENKIRKVLKAEDTFFSNPFHRFSGKWYKLDIEITSDTNEVKKGECEINVYANEVILLRDIQDSIEKVM